MKFARTDHEDSKDSSIDDLIQPHSSKDITVKYQDLELLLSLTGKFVSNSSKRVVLTLSMMNT